MNEESSQPNKEAVRLVLAHQTMLKTYIRMFIRDPYVAQETLSDVTLVILHDWEKYDTNRPFERWARGIVRNVALKNLRSELRWPFPISDGVVEGIAEQVDDIDDECVLECRKRALAGCIQRLPIRHRNLVCLRYFEERPYSEISGMVGRTAEALYVVVNRLLNSLHSCIDRQLRRQ